MAKALRAGFQRFMDDGGVIQLGKTVYVIAAGASFPADDEETTSTTHSFRGTTVGHGIDGVNEQMTWKAASGS